MSNSEGICANADDMGESVNCDNGVCIKMSGEARNIHTKIKNNIKQNIYKKYFIDGQEITGRACDQSIFVLLEEGCKEADNLEEGVGLFFYNFFKMLNCIF